MNNWVRQKVVKFKREHNWLSAVAFFTILLAAIGPSFVEWDKPLGEVPYDSTQNSQCTCFKRRIGSSEWDDKNEGNEKHPSNNNAKTNHVVRINSFSQNNGSTNNEGRTHAENR